MPKITKLEKKKNQQISKLKRKIIVLNKPKKKESRIIWLGLINKKKNVSEEPLVLNLDNQDFYFYSNQILKRNWTKKGDIYYRRKLGQIQKNKLIKAYEKKCDQNDLIQINTLIKLKIDYYISNFYSWRIMKRYLKNDNSLYEEIIKYKNQANKIYQEIKTFQNENTTDENLKNSLKKISDFNNRLNLLFDASEESLNKLSKIMNKNNENDNQPSTSNSTPQIEFESLIDIKEEPIIKEEIEFESLIDIKEEPLSDIEEIETDPLMDIDEEISASQSQPKNKTIVLTQNKNKKYTITWSGILEKKENSDEEPVVLNFNNQDYYFYSDTIKRRTKTWKKEWISYKTKLDKNQQNKLLKAYEKKINQNDLLQQNTLLTLKYNSCLSYFNHLNENLIQIKIKILNYKDNLNFKDKKLENKDIITLNHEIVKYTNQIQKIKQEINTFQNENNTQENLENSIKKISNFHNKLDSLIDSSEKSFNELSKKIVENIKNDNQPSTSNSTPQIEFESLIEIKEEPIIKEEIEDIQLNL